MTSLVSPQADCEEADSGRGRIGVLRTEEWYGKSQIVGELDYLKRVENMIQN